MPLQSIFLIPPCFVSSVSFITRREGGKTKREGGRRENSRYLEGQQVKPVKLNLNLFFMYLSSKSPFWNSLLCSSSQWREDTVKIREALLPLCCMCVVLTFLHINEGLVGRGTWMLHPIIWLHSIYHFHVAVIGGTPSPWKLSLTCGQILLSKFSIKKIY